MTNIKSISITITNTTMPMTMGTKTIITSITENTEGGRLRIRVHRDLQRLERGA
jgi:hypothetical protein